MVSDKWLLANFLTQYELCYPLIVLCTADEAFEQDLRKLPFPVLVKQREHLTDRATIQLFAGAEQLRVFLEDKLQHEGSYIVQGFVSGYDAGCDVLCQDSCLLTYTIRKACIFSCRP